MKILITGGAGFIGSHLSAFFAQKGAQVYIVDNLLTSTKKNLKIIPEQKNLQFIKADLCQSQSLKPLANVNFDLVYHLASPASPVQYERYPLTALQVNSFGTYYLLELVKKNKNTIFVYASTSEIYGDPLVHPQTETYWGNVNSFGPRSCYDEAKRFGEALCYTYLNKDRLNIRIARIFNTYGPNMEKEDGRVISNFIVQALTDAPLTIFGDGSQTRSFCYVDDMVQALYLMGQKSIKGQVINLGNPEEISVLDIAKLIKKLTGSNSSLVFKPLPEDDPRRRKPDISKAKKLLGWQPNHNLESGLKSTIAYFKKRFSL